MSSSLFCLSASEIAAYSRCKSDPEIPWQGGGAGSRPLIHIPVRMPDFDFFRCPIRRHDSLIGF